MKPKTGKNVHCKVCTKEIYREKNQLTSPNYFCSRKCYTTFRKGQDLGGWVNINCDECKQEFKKRQYMMVIGKRRHHFCTHLCYSKFKSKKGNTPHTGATKPERYFSELLEELNITYISQKLITSLNFGRCYYDFYLPDYNTVIEVDGDYWHGNPKIYDSLNEQQKRCKIRDQQKELVLKENNVILKRVWESDLYTLSKQQVVNLLNLK